MPVNIPNFNVAPLNPAALLRGREERGSDFVDNLIRDIFQIRARERAQEEEMSFRRELSKEDRAAAMARLREGERLRHQYRSEEEFEGLVARGDLVREPKGGFSLPGEELEFVDAPKGVQGRYVRREDLEGAKPLTELFPGRQLAGDARVRDVRDPASGQILPGRVDELTVANVDAAREVISQIPIRSIRDAATARLNEFAESGGFFSGAEAKQLEDFGVSLPDMANYAEITRRISQMNREDRQQFGATRLGVMSKYQTRDPMAPGGRRDLSALEADVVSMWAYGQSLTPQQQEVFEGLNIQPREDAADRASLMNDAFTGAASSSSQYFPQYTRWLEGFLLGNDGEPQPGNEELKRMIETTTGNRRLSPSAIEDYAASGGDPETRAAFAAWQAGFSTYSGLEAYLLNGGTVAGDPESILRGFELTNRNFFDRPAPPRGQSLYDGRNRGTAAPLTGEEVEDASAEGRSRYAPLRDAVRTAFEGASPEDIQSFRSVLEGTPEQAAGRLAQAAQNLRAMAGQPDATPEERAEAARLADLFEDLAGTARSNPARFIITRDSIFTPALRR